MSTFSGPIHPDGPTLRLLGSQRGRGGREEGPGDKQTQLQ